MLLANSAQKAIKSYMGQMGGGRNGGLDRGTNLDQLGAAKAAAATDCPQ